MCIPVFCACCCYGLIMLIYRENVQAINNNLNRTNNEEEDNAFSINEDDAVSRVNFQSA